MDNTILTKRLSKPGRIWRSFIRRFMYSQMAIRTGFMIAIGKEYPLVPFTVEKDPPSMYWVFRIKSSEVDNLEKKLGLPSQFSLCPIRCLATDEPDYLLAVNAYRVSGLANGIRAEWSIFVHDGNSTPRYMVVDARSSTYSVDPVSIITKASVVIHERRNDNVIHTQIGEGENAFTATTNLHNLETPVTASAEWVSANDYIYWGNGICDRTFYNAGIAHAKQFRISNENSTIIDGTFWGTLIDPEPVHTLMFDNEIQFVVSPWENVDRVRL